MNQNKGDSVSQPNQSESVAKLGYHPRSRFQKILPAAVFPVGLLVFVMGYWIAESNTDLLGVQFLIGTPFFIGSWVAYFNNYRHQARFATIAKHIGFVMFGIIGISGIILQEGIICIVMATPILMLAMLIGAWLTHVLCAHVWKSKALHSLIILPILVLFVPFSQQSTTYQSSNSIIIKAKPEQIWQTINHIDGIQAQEFYQHSWLMPLMKVPAPKSAITVWQDGKWVRKCQWHGNIRFDEPIISQIPNQQLRWQFVFYPDSVPPRTLDDHVTINGEHFKLLQGQYDIKAIDDEYSELKFQVSYQVSSSINFYAGWWANKVMSDFNQDVLILYKNRLQSVPSLTS